MHKANYMEQIKAKFTKWGRPEHDYNLRVLRHLFNEDDLKGKHVLDIGAGCGESSGFLIVEFGAIRATAVDSYEGHGSEISTHEEITGLKKILGNKLRVVERNIWDFYSEDRYGFIFNINSLHHIAESKKPLKKDHELERKVVGLFKRIGGWLEDDGKFVIFELARRNWSPIPTYRKRFKTVVDLSTKQDPWAWISALRKAGFRKAQLRYPAPVILDRFKFIHWLFDNYLMCILTGSGYLIEASEFRGDGT